jgi:SAM-dependent methyltransferase
VDKLVETKMERFWNREAWTRDQWVKAEAAKLPPGSRVLDAGAGASKYRPLFTHCHYSTQDFCRYEGPLVKYSQPIDYVCDMLEIPLPDASLDAIICTEVLEHVTDAVAVLREFSRLLKPGGKLFLTAPFISDLHMAPYHYYVGFTTYWYRHWLPSVGLVIDHIAPQGGPGRVAVRYLHGCYGYWRTWESKLSGLKRLFSLSGRMLVKIPVHYVAPWVLHKLDPHLNWEGNCVGLMVAATRKSDCRGSMPAAGRLR